MRNVKVGHVVGGVHAAQRFARGYQFAPPCDYPGCNLPSKEGERFRIKTPPGSPHKTKLTWFWRCAEHKHTHWVDIGYSGVER